MDGPVRLDGTDAGKAGTPELRFLNAGDRYLLIEFGTHISIRLNLMALQLGKRIDRASIPGVVETLPMFVSLLVHYDSTRLAPSALIEAVRRLWEGMGSVDDLEWPSRLIEMPVCYLDPWTRACVDDYCQKIKPIEYNPDFVVRVNGLTDTKQLVRLHSETQHWVGGVGFWPGLPDLIPLDPRCVLSVPKYDPPRLWTVPGAIGVGGGFTSIYPLNTPGGYRLIGRTPVGIYDLSQRYAPFRDSVVLFRPGDRVKFVPISVEEFEDLDRRWTEGTYVYNIVEYEVFSLRRYETWVAGVGRGRF